MPNQQGAALRRRTTSHAHHPDSPRHASRAVGASDLSTLFDRFRSARPSSTWQTVAAMGQIVLTPDDRPIRTIITGRRYIVTGSYASRKAGRALPFEGMNEPAFFMHSEVDTNVVDYRAQPFRFEFVLDGRNRVYIADCVRLLADGTLEVIEVKNDRRALRDPDYALKLERVREICQQLGWGFRVVLRAQLEHPRVRYANVVEVQSRRHVRFDASHRYVALDAVERAGGLIALGALAETLGGPQTGVAIAQAMMVGRVVDIDLSAPLGPDSQVRLVSALFAQNEGSAQ